MADTENLETPATLPEKQWWESNSMWAALLAMLAGVLEQNGKFADIALYIGANKDQLVGWVLQGLSLYGIWATLRRNSAVVVGK